MQKLDLPESWVWTTVSQLGSVVSGGTPSTKEPSYWGEEIAWISPSDLTGYSSKFITKGAKSITAKGLKNSSAVIMPKGSIHFSSRAPIGYVAISNNEISTNQGFKSLVPASGIFDEYVYYYFKSAKQLAESLATGTTFKELSGSAFSRMAVPLPPQEEQVRIVAKLEELFSELDKGVENLRTAQQQLKVYRQALLKHAFEGKLTAGWRAQNPDKLESAEALLARIRQEREARYQQQLAEWQAAQQAWEASGKTGSKPAKPKAPKVLPALTAEELAGLPELPEGWCWIKLGQIVSSVKDGPHFSPKYTEDGIPFISGGNVRPNGVDFSSAKKISPELHEELCKRCKPEVGDILYTKGGTTGIARVNTYNFEFNVWVHVAVLKPLDSIKSFYLQHALNSEFCYAQARKYTHGVGNQDLGLTRMVEIILPICSEREQERLVELVDDKISVIDQIENTITTSLRLAEALRQSILKKAFSGQLVPQNPDDEPASVLLARIRAERDAQQPATRRGRPRRAEA